MKEKKKGEETTSRVSSLLGAEGDVTLASNRSSWSRPEEKGEKEGDGAAL